MGSINMTKSKGFEHCASGVHPLVDGSFAPTGGRRSVVYGTKGIVASSQPLASRAGQKILDMGGNAADAAVAVAAALNMTEPCSTGIGGDAFCLYFDAKTKQIHSLNGSGRSPKGSTLAEVKKELNMPMGARGKIPNFSPLSVTVPGAPAAWVDTVKLYGSGKLTLEQILMPAIELGETGFPVSELASNRWHFDEQRIKDASSNFAEMLKPDSKAPQGCRAPRPGEIFSNPNLARTFRTLAAEGKKGFYSGRIGEELIKVLKSRGGKMELSDLEDHMNSPPFETTPISVKFDPTTISAQNFPTNYPDDYAVELWEHPPNGQGIVALIALRILEELGRAKKVPKFRLEDFNSATYLHTLIECLNIAFSDGLWYISDADHQRITPEQMISRSYLAERAKLFDPRKAQNHSKGEPSPAHNYSDTVYFCVTDKDGNGMSFINSNYERFGSCIIPQGCGFTLQNRGSNFELGPEDHPNVYAGGKRPYHTIIPGLVTYGDGEDRQLHSVFGVMGGFMQPQGHLQVLLNMEVFGMNPQQALDAPRICVDADTAGDLDNPPVVFLEEGIDEKVAEELQAMGHRTEFMTGWKRLRFGKGQVIRRHVDEETGQVVFSGGSEPRADGCALPQ